MRLIIRKQIYLIISYKIPITVLHIESWTAFLRQVDN